MAQYIEAANGYIIDNPNIDFLRCDGKVFSYDEVNTASWSNTSNNVTINGGWSAFPLAYIDTDKTMEVTQSSSQFDLSMFAMANATNEKDGDVGVLETKRFDVEAGNTINMPFEVQDNSVVIRGQSKSTPSTSSSSSEQQASQTPTTGHFFVTSRQYAAATEGGEGGTPESTPEVKAQTTITFNSSDVSVGDTVRVSYRRRAVNTSIVNVTGTGTTAKGEQSIHWPVYSSGTDCTESSIKGYLHVDIFGVRVTALPGFDNSYKSASTNSVTFSALDPKRADGRVYRMVYEPLGDDGIITETTNTNVDW